MFCALLTSRYQVSVYRTNGPLVCSNRIRTLVAMATYSGNLQGFFLSHWRYLDFFFRNVY